MPAISAYLDRRRIFGDFPPGERDDVLRRLVEAVVGSERMASEKATTILRGVLKRERVGTTGVGRGIAIPHTKTSAVDSPIVAYARLDEPIPYGASDGAPVHSLFLVVSPPEANDEHIAILKWIAGIARSDYYSTILRNTRDPQSLYDLFREIDGAA